MPIFNVYAAKAPLSRLIDEAVAGKEIVLSKAGKPAAKIVPLGRAPRRLGLLTGRLKVPDDFNAALPPRAQALFKERR